MSAAVSYNTWHVDPAREVAMEASHRPLWRHFIDTIPETELSRAAVLDFGCNRGGFLRELMGLKPFRAGLGVDIAAESIAAARILAGGMPLDYRLADELAAIGSRFDFAFSYEVVYLLPDLAAHAALMHRVLRDGGVYYAVTGCHTDNPLWPAWRDLIGGTTNAPLQDRSVEDYATTFAAPGFDVSLKRFGYDGFVPAGKDRRYYPHVYDALDYGDRHKMLFRLVKA